MKKIETLEDLAEACRRVAQLYYGIRIIYSRTPASEEGVAKLVIATEDPIKNLNTLLAAIEEYSGVAEIRTLTDGIQKYHQEKCMEERNEKQTGGDVGPQESGGETGSSPGSG